MYGGPQASAAEKKHLRHSMGIEKKGTRNTSVWRRSSLVVTAVAACFSFGFAVAALASKYERHVVWGVGGSGR